MSATISLYITHRSHYVYSNMLSLLYKAVLRAGLFPGWASFVPLIYTHGGATMEEGCQPVTCSNMYVPAA